MRGGGSGLSVVKIRKRGGGIDRACRHTEFQVTRQKSGLLMASISVRMPQFSIQ